MTRRRFKPTEPCAITPAAFGFFFDPPPPATVERRNDIAIVSVRGPLMHHEDFWCDSYDAIKARVVDALATTPKAIVLSIDSPGGLVSGCFDTTDEIRAICADAKVPLYAYVDGTACSAAYALACAGDVIVIPPTGTVGSIGCITELTSFAKLDEAMGVDRRLVMSGARKGDGNPSAPITDAAELAVQAEVDQLAAAFFDHVARARPMDAEEVRALDAGMRIGAAATPTLADEVMGLDEMLAAIAAGKLGSAARAQGETMDKKTVNSTKSEGDEEKPYAKARALLKKMADDGDEAAKAALAEMDKESEDDDEPETTEETTEDDKSDGEGKDAKALAARLDKIEADNAAKAAKAEADERASLLATRTDLDEPTKQLLATASIERVRAFVKEAPKRTPKLGAAAAGAVVTPTQGFDANAPAQHPRATGEGASIVAAALGKAFVQPDRDGVRQTFPALTRKEREAYVAKREAAAKAAAQKTA